jgi:hypothetical protein
MAHPNDSCPISRDEEEQTAFQAACSVLNINYPEVQAQLAEHEEFDQGWAVGIERDLGDHMFPNLHNTEGLPSEVYDSQRAFVLGLVAGLIAEQKGYPSPFCNYPEHQQACQAVNADAQAAKIKADNAKASEAADALATGYSSADTHRDPYLRARPVDVPLEEFTIDETARINPR